MSKIIAQPYANIRSVPIISKDTDIGDLMPGQIVNIVEVKGDWSRVKITLQHGGNFMGWVKSELIVDDAPPVVVVSPPPTDPFEKHRAATFLGLHDFGDVSFWADPTKRGWVLHTMTPHEHAPLYQMGNHRANGGKVILRLNLGYGTTAPRNEQEALMFFDWVRTVAQEAKGQVDAFQFFNEPDLELSGQVPGDMATHLADIHNRAADIIRWLLPGVLIAPAPIGWLMPIDGKEPGDFYRRFLALIQPHNRTLMIAHAYCHGVHSDPNQKFGDDPLRDYFFNERTLENQLAVFPAGTPVLIGEWNPGSDERDVWPDADNGRVERMMAYFASFRERVIGAIAFRWEHSPIHGISYGIKDRWQTIDRMKRAQALFR